ncbi:hypothetical protein CEXT_806601 [Caerostris extrusa]|uniref:Uncharacterized protein n=1 Tax=Caerostris extrusa TaxID=172846 RepID=A0AAV4UCI1_CAEEX|nr:hypothetical protein CEXT_806601 [Caerostris extrusa]
MLPPEDKFLKEDAWREKRVESFTLNPPITCFKLVTRLNVGLPNKKTDQTNRVSPLARPNIPCEEILPQDYKPLARRRLPSEERAANHSN